jgi:GntR family transcriptional regulator, rspAB operon transcriptional repressor
LIRKSPTVASRGRGGVRRKPQPVGDRPEDRGTASASRRNGKKTVARSLAQRAYETIKHEIITCALRPGEYINEAQLSTRLGIGRTPVHQAIGQLQQEQLIDVMPRKGILVRPISLDEYLHLDETRVLLEVAAMRMVAERISRDALQQLENILAKAHAARKARNLQELLLSDRDFHFGLARATQNPVLAGMLCAAYERSLRVWFVSARNIIIEDSRDDHEQILGALRRRDGEAAARIMREHILSSRSYTMRSA